VSKNKAFEVIYQVRLKGITTNDFLTKHIDEVLQGVLKILESQHKQLDIEVIKEVKK